MINIRDLSRCQYTIQILCELLYRTHTIAVCMDIWEVSHNNLPVVSQLELPEKLYLLQQKLSIGVQKRIATKILKLLEVIIGNVEMELIYGIT